MDEIRERLQNDSKYGVGRWVTDREAEYLCKLIQDHNVETVYESGTANGFSAAKMGKAADHVITYDPNKRPHIWEEKGFEHYKKNITYIQDGFENLELHPDDQCGSRLFFIDGDHGGVAATRDLQSAMKYFEDGDVIALHDFNEKKVVKVWQRFDKSGWTTHIEDTERMICVMTRNSNRSLKDIAYETGTDKKHTRHNFVAIYDELFKDIQHEPINFLEIGVYLCRSHNMWVEWFDKATIYGIDINDTRFNKYDRKRLVLDNVDQGDKKALVKYGNRKGPWRVIIDDGSHINSHQKLTFETLWDYVEPGGYYIIEDTHTSYWEHMIDCDQTLVQRMLEVTDELSTAPHHKHYYSNILRRRKNEDLTKYQNEIEYMTYRMGMIVIKKRDDV